MPAASSTWSLWCGTVELLQLWSSPASTTAALLGPVPPMLACLNTSPLRSTPGPLPYQMPLTPSTCGPGNRCTLWLPITAVAASSSFTAGWCTMRCSCSRRPTRARVRSYPASGEPS